MWNEALNKRIHTEGLDLPEYGVLVHRILSDGQLPAMEDLSENLHKKMDSLEEQIGADEVQSTESSNSERTDGNYRDLSNWIKLPFVNFYNLMNKNTVKFDAIHDYSHVRISSFKELEHQGGVRLLLPIGFNDTVILIYDDEATIIISYALASTEYHFQLTDACEKVKDGMDSPTHLPFFDVGNKAKKLLERAVWNDTSFLASIDVIDYFLVVGVDEENHELTIGIIAFMRQYTWNKRLGINYFEYLTEIEDISLIEEYSRDDVVLKDPPKFVFHLGSHARIQNHLMQLFQLLVSDFVHEPLIRHGYNSYVVVALLLNRLAEPILELKSSSSKAGEI